MVHTSLVSILTLYIVRGRYFRHRTGDKGRVRGGMPRRSPPIALLFMVTQDLLGCLIAMRISPFHLSPLPAYHLKQHV